MSIRDTVLANEEKILSEFAFKTSKTQGRLQPIETCPIRTDFQRDRDRIIHCTSFRRLMHKTQVFLSPTGDHYRTRLTHTLEVCQIARNIARALRLNEDLCEAAALGHDLGHTPFGHAGEDVLRECYDKNYSHYEQGIRVVEILENNGKGLNLTYEVKDGIRNHSGENMASTLEGVIIKFADRIAYINHDIDDACRAGVLKESSIPKKLSDCLGNNHSDRINTMVTSIVKASEGKNIICMTPEIKEATDELRSFLFKEVYLNPTPKAEEGKAKDVLRYLYQYFCKYPNKMPELYQKNLEKEGIERNVCDYISGMTDRYAINTFSNIYIPRVWGG